MEKFRSLFLVVKVIQQHQFVRYCKPIKMQSVYVLHFGIFLNIESPLGNLGE